MSDANGHGVNLLEKLRQLDENENLNTQVFIKSSTGKDIALRVCAMRKTPVSIERTQKKLRRKESLKQVVLADDTKEFNNYIVLITSLPDEIVAEQVLELYQLRWQVEIYFKRLKSIMDFGELPKRRTESVMAWLNGKMMIAILIERVLCQSRSVL